MYLPRYTKTPPHLTANSDNWRCVLKTTNRQVCASGIGQSKLHRKHLFGFHGGKLRDLTVQYMCDLTDISQREPRPANRHVRVQHPRATQRKRGEGLLGHRAMRLGKLLRTWWFGFPVGKLIEQQYHMNMTTQRDHDTKDKRGTDER